LAKAASRLSKSLKVASPPLSGEREIVKPKIKKINKMIRKSQNQV